jgi:hypothetical protein
MLLYSSCCRFEGGNSMALPVGLAWRIFLIVEYLSYFDSIGRDLGDEVFEEVRKILVVFFSECFVEEEGQELWDETVDDKFIRHLYPEGGVHFVEYFGEFLLERLSFSHFVECRQDKLAN